ncbi:hypothetical protein [Deinococcus arenicola]|uniref:EF-hand domain-containing protein n=1 Tax=Deinococcus arenicola TaxID=2994950 RepID=A0ABU4DTV7_9DEIO|nr:hypothetical protein [Deinococcus sp. ZS9-10]MDV6375124.1 hypothetical protein [Deinococcus sp. ZS9-10]
MNPGKRYLFAGLTVLLAGCTQPAADSPPSGIEAVYTDFFKEADTDRSGTLEAGEIGASIDRDFAGLDLTHDGVVTIDDIYSKEQAEPPGSTRNPDLSSHLPYDTDSDGRLTAAEHRAHLLKLIGEMDIDGDGLISFTEYRVTRRF